MVAQLEVAGIQLADQLAAYRCTSCGALELLGRSEVAPGG